jgi:dihydrofolate reductase
MMEVVLIAAMSMNRVIGNNHAIPWHIPGEQQRFKKTTWGYPVIMGRKTFDSIGRPLPGRRNIIISRNADLTVTGCEIALTLKTALALCADAERVFVIGGEQIFIQALPLADTIILTTIPRQMEGDTFFPGFEQNFSKVCREEIVDPEPYVVEVYCRNR